MSLDHGTLGTQAYNLVETTRSRSSSAIIVSTSSFAPRVFHRASEGRKAVCPVERVKPKITLSYLISNKNWFAGAHLS